MSATTLIRPAAGRHTRVPFSGSETLVFSFNPADAVFSRRAASLTLTFANGASIEITDFFSGGNVPATAMTLADGARMNAAELLALFAPYLALPPNSGLPAFSPDARGLFLGSDAPDLSALAAEEEFVFSPENARADDSARRDLLPVYREVVIRDGEITLGPSVYGNLFVIGAETGLHVHLDNGEADMLDVDDLVARLPNLFPEAPPVRAVAVTGGVDNKVVVKGGNLSAVLETVPVDGLGTTQFDHYEYRHNGGVLSLYIETLLPVSREKAV